MLTRVCTLAKRTGRVSVASRCSSKPVAAPRPFKKSYCAPVQASDSLADAVAKNGKITEMPSGLSNANEPTERVIQLAEQIMNISFIEAAQLTRILQKRLGTSGMVAPSAGYAAPAAAAPAAAPAAAAPAAEAPKPAEAAKPSRVDLKLVSFPEANKFKVLKEMRNLKPGMNLMESKALIEGLPKVVQEGLLYKDAEDWKKALNEAGAEVEFA